MGTADAQTVTKMNEVAESIGERLARVNEPGQLIAVTDLTSALIEGMNETSSAGIGPVRQAVRHYLQKYDKAQLPQTPAVLSVLRDH